MLKKRLTWAYTHELFSMMHVYSCIDWCMTTWIYGWMHACISALNWARVSVNLCEWVWVCWSLSVYLNPSEFVWDCFSQCLFNFFWACLSCLSMSESVRICFNLIQSFWNYLSQCECVSIRLRLSECTSESVWINLNVFQSVWICLSVSESVWFHLILSESF